MSKPERCPFLQSEHYSKRFEGGRDKMKFDFCCQLSSMVFNAMSDYPSRKGCLNGEYFNCRNYTERIFQLSLTTPPLCPLIVDEDKCEITGKECSEYWIEYKDDIDAEDYRKCQIFSKWWWKTAAQKQAKR